MNTNDTLQDIFGEVISAYTRAQAIEDGVLVDGNVGDLDEVTRQHFKIPVAMTRRVFDTMERAVENKRHCNDYKGVWHDILWMSHSRCARMIDRHTSLFTVIIKGAGRQTYYHMKAVCGPGDNGEPVLTIMFQDED